MAAVRIRVSFLLSADERAALAAHYGKTSIGSTDACTWAEGELRACLAAIVSDHLRNLEERSRRALEDEQAAQGDEELAGDG